MEPARLAGVGELQATTRRRSLTGGFGCILRDPERNDLDAEDDGLTISYGGWMQPDPASL